MTVVQKLSGYVFDALLELEDGAGAFTADGAGSDIVDFGDSHFTGEVVISASALTTGGTTITGTADAGGSSTVLIDAAATFQTDGVAVGDTARNITDAGNSVTVVSIDSETQLTTTALTGGGSDDWATGDTWEVDVEDETYQVLVELSDSSTFASGIENVGIVEFGGNDGGSPLANRDVLSVAPLQLVLSVHNQLNDRQYRFMRLWVIVFGFAPSITFTAFLSKDKNSKR